MFKKEFEFERKLRSGITLKIENQAEWILYHQIFLEGEYDFSIKHTLKSIYKGRTLHFLDLGANVGFFALRIADFIINNYRKYLDFEVTCVEGSPTIYNLLESRMKENALLKDKIKLIHGLVGKRQGENQIFEFSFHAINSMYLQKEARDFECYTVPFVNVSNLFENDDEISLLKCDIEGAELEFLENYQDLMAKVRYAVFEFHHDLCDTERCYSILRKLGFVNHQLLRSEPLRSVHFLGR